MEKEQKTIQDFDFNMIWEYFIQLNRQGPGNIDATLKALSFIDNLSDSTKIADLGCGTGGQTMILAQNTNAKITALDLIQGAVDNLNGKAKKLKLHERVKGIVGSMDNLPFEKNEFDVIWSEGAIDCIGFEKGLNHWREFLKVGGYVAITNLTWFTNERPAELEKFYLNAVPDMATVGQNVSIMQKAGYIPVAAFILPEECWTENYLKPKAVLQDAFLKKHAGNIAVETFIADDRYEEELYYKYKQYFGYAFYIGKKIEINL